MSIGVLIKNKRNELGISHEKLAKQVGVSKRSLIYWEQGVKQISVDNADKVLKALGASYKIGAT